MSPVFGQCGIRHSVGNGNRRRDHDTDTGADSDEKTCGNSKAKGRYFSEK